MFNNVNHGDTGHLANFLISQNYGVINHPAKNPPGNRRYLVCNILGKILCIYNINRTQVVHWVVWMFNDSNIAYSNLHATL